jgi:hypothetical protein
VNRNVAIGIAVQVLIFVVTLIYGWRACNPAENEHVSADNRIATPRFWDPFSIAVMGMLALTCAATILLLLGIL